MSKMCKHQNLEMFETHHDEKDGDANSQDCVLVSVDPVFELCVAPLEFGGFSDRTRLFPARGQILVGYKTLATRVRDLGATRHCNYLYIILFTSSTYFPRISL